MGDRSSGGEPPRRDSGRLRISRSKTLTNAGGQAEGTGRFARVDIADDTPRFPDDGVLAWVRENMYQREATVPGPYGPHPRRYFDFTASGLPFKPIEDLLAKHVLPWMSNTHSSSSYASELITAHVEGAHRKVRAAMRGTEDDIVVFTGSGATGAVNKLINCLGLRVPDRLGDRYNWIEQIDPEERPIVLLSRMEHHSNDLPWRESIAEVEFIGYDDHGRADWRAIDRLLSSPEFRDRKLKIGSFTAASNVTGVLNDTKELAAAMHAHGGMAFFDYAAAGPYVPIDLHPDDDPRYQKDAVFLSMHKFTGGPQSPGLLVANKAVFACGAPAEPGGGTVLYTSPWEYRYVDDLQQREESGTPPIINVIRAGLAFDLKLALGKRLVQLEEYCVQRCATAWRDHPRIAILGPDPLTVPRIGILSILIDGGKLHHNLAVRLLNDLHGIQVRGGCMCAGTYGHDLLQIDKTTSKQIRDLLDSGNIAAKPGWVRISFGPAVRPDDLEVLIKAVPQIADHWRDYANDYILDEDTADWRHKDDRPATSDLRFKIPDVLAALSGLGR